MTKGNLNPLFFALFEHQIVLLTASGRLYIRSFEAVLDPKDECLYILEGHS